MINHRSREQQVGNIKRERQNKYGKKRIGSPLLCSGIKQEHRKYPLDNTTVKENGQETMKYCFQSLAKNMAAKVR
jgi:hypothetical protein